MATDLNPRTVVDSLENGLITLRAVPRKTEVDRDRHLLAAFSLAFECARNAIQEELARHGPCDAVPQPELFRLAQRQGLVQSQSRWETYHRFHKLIEHDRYPDVATTVARYLPAFTLDVEMLTINLRKKHQSGVSDLIPHHKHPT